MWLHVQAVIVFEISLSQVFDVKICLGNNSKMQRAITRKNKMNFFKYPPGNLLIILYQLSKFEAPSSSVIVFEISSFLS